MALNNNTVGVCRKYKTDFVIISVDVSRTFPASQTFVCLCRCASTKRLSLSMLCELDQTRFIIRQLET
jgi:hypothetical protein